MDLMPPKTRRALPPIGAGEAEGLRALARVHYFLADSGWEWFASEFDGDDLLFGLVVGFEAELGYFRLSELYELRGTLGLPVERDRYFKPVSLLEVLREPYRDPWPF